MFSQGSDETAELFSDSDIAVIGMAGRFPRARNLEEFWRNLRDGVESVVTLTDEELLASGIEPAVFNGADYVRAASVLEDAEMFDAAFFGFTPREADVLDPQQRIFLECAWEALEGAGYDPDRYPGAVGVFAGVSLSTYLINLYLNRALLGPVSNYQLTMANDKDHLPTRVSYKLNLKGPSINVQTACSTSLVAVHLACQSLLSGECDMALAGGVSVSFPQRRGYVYQEGNINSPDGHCRAFDADARGTIGGNGAGVVLLKRLADAFADGDVIQAVVKGSAVNNDGSVKVGYTAPSVEGQARVIAEALSLAGVEPETVTCVEAHGTGTALGDPIEMAALTQVFGARTRKKNYCAVGSVKTNIGHLDAAAGVAGLIKTVLALKHRQIPPSLHFVRPNPKIDFADSPFFVNASLREWGADGAPRRAGVSSFGIGGTNAHVVLQEAAGREPPGASRPWQLLLWSARTDSALERMTENLAAHLGRLDAADFADACYTLQVGRKPFEHRRALVCRDAADALSALAGPDPERVLTAVEKSRERPVVFMFPGQGAQRLGMGAELYRAEPAFRAHIDRCAESLAPVLGYDLRRVLYGGAGGGEDARLKLDETAVTQPALFATEYALAQLWMGWGVRPSAMIGHSLGEFVAACLAGVFSLEDALALVAERGRLMQQLPEGAMLAVPLPEAEVVSLLDGGLSLAAVNAAKLCVVSGPGQEVEALERRLEERGVSGRRLHTSRAFHSTMVEPVVGAFQRLVSGYKLRKPTIPYVSNLTGRWITEAEATDAAYWARHLRQTVRFADGLSELLREPDQILLEVGPGRTLGTLARRHPAKAASHAVLDSLPAQPAEPEQASLLQALGRLWQAGVKLDWKAFYAGERRRRLALPTYPFERRRHWVGVGSRATAPQQSHGGAQAQDGEQTTARVVETTAALPPSPPSSPHAEVPANGHGDGARKAAGTPAPERLVAQQLEIMSRQLAILRQRR